MRALSPATRYVVLAMIGVVSLIGFGFVGALTGLVLVGAGNVAAGHIAMHIGFAMMGAGAVSSPALAAGAAAVAIENNRRNQSTRSRGLGSPARPERPSPPDVAAPEVAGPEAVAPEAARRVPSLSAELRRGAVPATRPALPSTAAQTAPAGSKAPPSLQTGAPGKGSAHIVE